MSVSENIVEMKANWDNLSENGLSTTDEWVLANVGNKSLNCCSRQQSKHIVCVFHYPTTLNKNISLLHARYFNNIHKDTTRTTPCA